jgi:hypothetical protein
VQGNIDLKKCKNKLEEYSTKINLIVKQSQTIKQLKKHTITKTSRNSQVQIGGKVIAEDYSPYV